MTKEESYQKVAEACHMANKVFCNLIGDNSQPDWENAPQWQKTSALEGVKRVALNPNLGDDALHNSWMQDKLDRGWKWGKEKDAELKTHPCIVAFSALPSEQQAKDKLFMLIAREGLKFYGV